MAMATLAKARRFVSSWRRTPTFVLVAPLWVGACIKQAPFVAEAGAPGETCDGLCVANQPVNCAAAEQGIEFAPFMVADFEQTDGQQFVAQYLYSYTDDTSTIYEYQDDATTDSGISISTGIGYQPPAVTENRCASAPPGNHIFHIAGGPFLGWGGGIGVGMQHINQDKCLVASPPDYCPASDAEKEVGYAALDLSKWDGVAVWARRGPESQPLLRVLVGEKHTDDDISFLMYQDDRTKPRYCERVRECACVNHMDCGYQEAVKPCTTAGYYCGFCPDHSGMTMTRVDTQSSNTCNVTRCDEVYPAFPDRVDTQFKGRPCMPFAFSNGVQSSYCFDPTANPPDPPPAQPDQQCGDSFSFPLHLTTEWQLYLVPFASMAQQGFAKKAPFMDLKSVSAVRLTWDMGKIDYFVDNIRFYRIPRP